MNELSEAIEQAKRYCLSNGNGEVKIKDNVIINAEWEEWEEWENNSNYDVITIYIFKYGFIKFRYQLEETKVKAD